ncbi:sensor histidine kinase [Terribacillus saccharophilus]|uniref:histidine kinase n=1 Tax=Terribacillus saccharophilus TaxID=361277 RepID=A0A268AGA3_9BACI|nr:HAMP domain-containing sensor histidine kinase [Terribacillus saccharophilus]PAD23140.1 hypothetical protein CHH64_00555 [Terribacillus saccharophilus]
MKKIMAIIKRFIVMILLLFVLLITMNVLIFIVFFSQNVQSYQKSVPIKMLESTSNALNFKDGQYQLDTDIQEILDESNIWALLIENKTGKVAWSFQVPDEVPVSFELTDVSRFSRYYLEDYPVFTWEYPDGLLVLGYPKNSYTKLNNDYPVSAIKELPFFIILVILIDLLVVFIFYFLMTKRMNRHLSPIIEGITLLSKGKPVKLEKKEMFEEITESINQTSIVLEQKNYSLHLKEQNREKWIEGVSHDIRTPLSLILGYSEKLKDSKFLHGEDLQRAKVIADQSIIIKELIENLNLVSYLEVNGLHTILTSINPIKIMRQITTEILNRNQDESYNIHFDTEGLKNMSTILGNEHLFKRAVSNLLLNSMKHNPHGCDIYIKVIGKEKEMNIIIRDTGRGLSSSALISMRELFKIPQKDIYKNRKGLGLLIVKEIVEIHSGEVTVTSPAEGGLETTLTFPVFNS